MSEVRLGNLLDALRAEQGLREEFVDFMDQMVQVTEAEEYLLQLLSDGKPHLVRSVAQGAYQRGLLPPWVDGIGLGALGDPEVAEMLQDQKCGVGRAAEVLLVQAGGVEWQVTERPAEVLQNLVSRKLPRPGAPATTGPRPALVSRRVREAEDLLASLLLDGPVDVEVVRAEAAAAGIPWTSIVRARQGLELVPVKKGFPGRIVAWRLPDAAAKKLGQ